MKARSASSRPAPRATAKKRSTRAAKPATTTAAKFDRLADLPFDDPEGDLTLHMDDANLRRPGRELRQSHAHGALDDENPEWTEEDFSTSKPGSEVFSPEFLKAVAAEQRKRGGRPKAAANGVSDAASEKLRSQSKIHSLQKLYDDEINFSIETFSGFTVKLGDPMHGFTTEVEVRTFDEAIAWLSEQTAVRSPYGVPGKENPRWTDEVAAEAKRGSEAFSPALKVHTAEPKRRRGTKATPTTRTTKKPKALSKPKAKKRGR